MSDDPRAGQLPSDDDLIDVDALIGAYHDERPDPSEATQRVSFGTSGHRGTALARTFNEAHVLAISEAVARHRKAAGIDGPLFLGRDTHALSEPATRTIVEVLAAHGIDVVLDADDGATPTPVVSHAILAHNRGGGRGTADGIVVTPSHNPPGDGGFKYNPPHGGPADTDVTGAIQDAANELLEADLQGVERVRFEDAEVRRRDYVSAYVEDLAAVIDLEAIRGSGLKLGVDPLGGASLPYWERIAERRSTSRSSTTELDPTFRFVPLDWDGKIRMDCSSPYAMSRLRDMADRFDVAFANDPDADRHGIVVPSAGLLNPNHHLAVCIEYLFGGAREWDGAGIGKTLVSSSMIDRVAEDLGRRLVEVPVGFKWFVDGLLDGSLGFGGEESAGASFLRRDGGPWSTDKDGLIPCLLAAEMTAADGRDPGARYARAGRALRRGGLQAHRRRGHAGREGGAEEAVARPGRVVRARRRGDHRRADRGARQRRADRRAEGGQRGRLVRGAAVRHRGRLQGLRGVVPRRGAPRADRGGGAGDREGRAGRMSAAYLAPLIALVIAAGLAGVALLLIQRPAAVRAPGPTPFVPRGRRIVVIGGGFAGLQAVHKLRKQDVDVTLIDRRNFHLFQPLVYQVATGALSPGEIATPLRSIFSRAHNVRVLLGEVTRIDLERHVVAVEPPIAELPPEEVPYDALLVAAGSKYSYFGHEEWTPYAPEVKSLESALDVRHRILAAFEAAELEEDPAKRGEWLTFAVVGAGPTGVEMAGQIAELARDTLPKDFRSADPSAGRILLVEGGPRVLAAFPPDLSESAERQLDHLGVTTMVDSLVVGVDDDGVELQHPGGARERVGARTVIWAAGVAAASLAGRLAEAAGAEVDRAGRIVVEPDLTLYGHPDVMALGDMAVVKRADGEGVQDLPGVAPVAMQQGRYAAKSVVRRLHGHDVKPFKYVDKGNLATIGRARAVAEIKRAHFGGALAWLLWLGIHIFYLIGFQNRLLVLLRWSFSFLTRGRGARLITGEGAPSRVRISTPQE